MHVLWFSGVELPAVTGSGLTRAGWQEGLRAALERYQPEIRLSIASFGGKPYAPIKQGNATYYHITRTPQPQGRWSRLVESWRHRSFRNTDLEGAFQVYQQINPDLVFIFGTENPFGLLTPRMRVPVVISIQAVLNGLLPRLFYGLPKTELVRELLSRRTLTGQSLYHKWLTHRKNAAVEREIYHLNRYFCGRTDWDRSWMEKLNPEARYFHIDRVLNPLYQEQAWTLENSHPGRIFALSGNAPFKGAASLVRTLILLRDQGGSKLTLRLGGVDPESPLGQAIQRMITAGNLSGQVQMLGRISPAKIQSEMLQARIFVLPSHLDNSPNSLAEAMLLGLPCIASDAGGIPSMIKDQVEGLIYPDTDLDQLASKINRLINNPGEARQFGQAARKRAQARHNPQAIASAAASMYRMVIEEGGTG